MALPWWWNDVKAVMAKYGVPTSVWAPILIAESGGKEKAHNPGTATVPEDSWGLFQLNRKGGQGAGYSPDQLVIPQVNAEIAARYIGPAVKKCGAGNLACIAVNSGHPGLVPTSDPRVRNIVGIGGAFSGARSELEAWIDGLKRNGQPGGGGGGEDPEPGGGIPGMGILPAWFLNPALLPASIASGTADLFSDWFGLPTKEDVGWSLLFGAAGGLLVMLGLNGMVIASGVPSQLTRAAGVVAGVPGVVNEAASAAGKGFEAIERSSGYSQNQAREYLGELADVV